MISKMPKVTSEDQLKGTSQNAVALRRKVIDALNSEHNLQRKREAYKAYDCLKDKTENYVLDLLLKQFDLPTVIEMQYALSNISILRKVIEKLAKVYALGVKRTMPKDPKTKPAKPLTPPKPKTQMVKVPHPQGLVNLDGTPVMLDAILPRQPQDLDEEADALAQPDGDVGTPEDPDTQMIEEMAQFLKLDTAMKKCNRYYRTFKNTLVYTKPVPNDDDPSKYDLEVDILAPFHYDVIETPNKPKLPLCIILSDYVPHTMTRYSLGDAAVAGRSAGHVREISTPVPDAKQSTASQDEERENRTYIWWTKNYHFTTDSKGVIAKQDTDDVGENPIKELPFVNVCGDQDGCFWAEGGTDLVDAGIKINTHVTNVDHIGISQGHGQLYMTGKDLPKSVKVGPNHCIQLKHEDAADPQPVIGYLNANPQLAELRKNIEMKVAMMLSTNNLSVSSFATSLESGKDFASGIAMMLDKAESLEDIGEQAKIFIEREPMVWGKIGLWREAYRSAGLLSEKMTTLTLPKKPETVQLQFPTPKPLISEDDELNIIEKRRDIGLNTMIELIMRDNPSLTEEEAQEKLDKLKTEKAADAAANGPVVGEGRDGLELFAPAPPAAPGAKPAAPGAPVAPGAQPKGGLNGNQSQKGGGVSGPNGVNTPTNQGVKATGRSKGKNKK